MRILFLSNDIGRGGAERQVVDLAIAMQRKGHQVAVGVLMKFLEFEDTLNAAGVQTFSLGLSKKMRAPIAYPNLIRAVRAFRPDVMHAHLFWATIAARLARPLTGVPVLLATSHCPFEREDWRYRALALTDRFCDQWTTVARQGLQTHLNKRAIRSGIVVQNGIPVRLPNRPRQEVRRELGLNDGDFFWMSLGSLRDDQKDYPNLIDALALGAPGRVMVAGTGKERAPLEAYATSKGVADRLTFLGLRTDVPDLLAAADGYVQSSWYEALPIALLEAATLRVPTVATDVGDNRTVLPTPAHGLLVPGKDPRSLADAMVRMTQLSLPERAAMGQRAEEHVLATFALDVVVNKWLAVYQAIANKEPVTW